ncbi:MAG: phosphate/phosphonate ABC transporter permease, partial [Desulforhopalus sp.]|nr:phosphate/phosphonate ABC transporter permease [Desulforhopalus sp.]
MDNQQTLGKPRSGTAVSELHRIPTIPACPEPPPRFHRPNWQQLTAAMGLVVFTSHALHGTELSSMSLTDIAAIPANILRLIGEMLPPGQVELARIVPAILETLQMALVGTVLGVLVSMPLGILAAKSLSPHRLLYFTARGVVSFCRTVPDLVWAIFFVVIVGLGPLAGMLTLLVDTIGFAGRFFAEAFEEVDSGPREAFSAIGASGGGTFFSAILPAAAPSCINTSMYCLERAVQSSVILGLVGAGGIGMLLEEPMV